MHSCSVGQQNESSVVKFDNPL